MSWDEGTKYMEDYRAGLRNYMEAGGKRRWFTDGVESLEDLVDQSSGKFSRQEENDAWEELLAEGVFEKVSMQAPRLRARWLMGIARDIRVLMVSGHAATRSTLDHERFNDMRNLFSGRRLDELRDILAVKDQGLTTPDGDS